MFLARLSAHQLPWMYLALAAVAVLLTRTRAGSLARGRSLPALLARVRAGNVPVLGGRPHGDLGAARALRLDGARRDAHTDRVLAAARRDLHDRAGAAALRADRPRQPARRHRRRPRRPLDDGIPGRAPPDRGIGRHPPAHRARARTLRGGGRSGRSPRRTRARHSRRRSDPWSCRHAYLGRVAALVLLSTIAFTLGDYVFKSAVAQAVAPAGSRKVLRVLLPRAQRALHRWRRSCSRAG